MWAYRGCGQHFRRLSHQSLTVCHHGKHQFKSFIQIPLTHFANHCTALAQSDPISGYSTLQHELGLYNRLLHSWMERGEVQNCFEVFFKMKTAGIEPDSVTYEILINACLKLDDIDSAFRLLLDKAEEAGKKHDALTGPAQKSNAHELDHLLKQMAFRFTPKPSLLPPTQSPSLLQSSGEAGDKLALPLNALSLPTQGNTLAVQPDSSEQQYAFPAIFNPQTTTSSENTQKPSTRPLPNKSSILPLGHEQILGSDSSTSDLVKQLQLETRLLDLAVQRYSFLANQHMKHGRGASLVPAQKLVLGWFTPLTQAIQKEVANFKDGSQGRDLSIYGPFLALVPAETLAVITIHEALSKCLIEPQGARLLNLSIGIGKAVQAELNVRQMKKHQVASKELKRLKRKGQNGVTIPIINARAIKLLGKDGEWTEPLIAKVGASLLNLLVQFAKVNSKETEAIGSEPEIPAFVHDYRYEKSAKRKKPMKMVGVVKPHARVLELIEDGHALRATVRARLLPMIIPPKPWTQYDVGGYLTTRSPVMRTRGSDLQVSGVKNAGAAIRPVYKALNILGRTPWLVNPFVHNVIEKVWATGGGLGSLPSLNNVPMPEPPANTPIEKLKQVEQDDEDVPHYATPLAKWKRECLKVEQQNRDLHSLRCDTTYKLEVARAFAQRKFYFPHNMDFRGRAYPIPPHLNHMGSDLCRGLLQFAEKQAIGERGLRWLKVHTANLFGMDKIPMPERVEFIEKHMDDVIDSGTKPLDGRGWWKTAEQPFQFLAACRDLSLAVQLDHPERYQSFLPIHQDGSCNGLQHYAALGRDRWGGEAVNLLPSSEPRDVYTNVAHVVAKKVKADAAAGKEMARLLDGLIDRKLVKQTVMTSVYGVTFVGAREQIRSRLNERNLLHEDKRFAAACYLASLTLSGLGQLFSAARNIMDWMGTCAKLIAQSNEPVMWTTPMGLPVVQPYRRSGSYVVRTVMQNVTLVDSRESLPVSANRQKSAFPPNYVHSLDSTHMLMTTLACDKANIMFAAVHDSFWTHAGQIDNMNALLRDAFVELHEQPLLEELLASWKARHPNIEFPPLPERGDLDLSAVRQSIYFFN